MIYRFLEAAILVSSYATLVTPLDILPVTKTAQPDPNVDAPIVSADLLNQAFAAAEADYNSRIALENNLTPTDFVPTNNKAATARHYRYLAYKQITADLDFNSTLFESASIFLKKQLGLTADQARFGLKKVAFPNGASWDTTRQQCLSLFQETCDFDSKFRNIDGSCNNKKNPDWGRSYSCMPRLLPPAYSDGISSPRRSKSNGELPLARSISHLIDETLETQNANYSAVLMNFGQFLTHDIAMGLMTRTVVNHSMLSCCPIGTNKHKECLAIDIPNDPNDFFIQNGQNCINFVRQSTCNRECTLGPRQQSNQLSAYIDATVIYGNTDAQMKELRALKDGLLLSQQTSSGEFLPASDRPTEDQCSKPEDNLSCFKAGDRRVNEQLGLVLLHTLFMRHHNRLAKLFKVQYPDYNDEQLYQLTRRVVTAQYQNIAFNEFNPMVIGNKYVEYFSLKTGQASEYDPNEEAGILNEFMAAANRFGHTLIQNNYAKGLDAKTSVKLSESFFTPYIVMNGDYDPLLEGLYSYPGKLSDPHIVTGVSHYLYRQKEVLFGLDLASLNIQRGREQGVPGYTKYIKYCFNKDISNFEDLDQFMTKQNRRNLKNIYNDVEDIDLYTGGVSESKLTGAAVGPTFGCIIGIQFLKLKNGDRFYFEHKDQAGSFTEPQLSEIRKTTLAQIICENTPSIQKILPDVFLLASDRNQLTDCTNIKSFDHSIF